eukprot:CAMPEP_0205921676 /NCGR_PEP_ID=MMETSP1325-20131115/13241_1 /ASSEMBLY_ACC=CAM_ASM_000708 /TAXON_ID=236786 /ORGANISM="Florenciella sp., Strain RCC1007" /LENGTH=88 /DNA_ID=CAMNT_0053289557 /DNA_START=44 /DNA_END=310 /DNA_ORIENTATION=-
MNFATQHFPISAAAVWSERCGDLDSVAILKHLSDHLSHVELRLPACFHINLFYRHWDAELPPSLIRLLIISRDPYVPKPFDALRAAAA